MPASVSSASIRLARTMSNSPESFAAFLKKDRDMYEQLIRTTGIKGD